MRETARRGEDGARRGPRPPAEAQAAQAAPPPPPAPPAAFARGLAKSLREALEIATPAGPVLIPAPGPYRSVFAWDSGWHYFWLKRLDPGRARAELASLLACAEPDGRIPHEKPLPGQAGYGLVRRLQLRLLEGSFAPSGASWFIDPPIYLVAAADALADASGGTATATGLPGARNTALADIEARARAALGWIDENRLAAFLPRPWSRLPALLHPLESGTDFSPAFDAVWGRPPLLQLRSLAILPRLAREGWSLARAGSFPLPLLFDPCYLAFWLGARRALLPGQETEDLVEAYWQAAFDPASGLFRQFAVRSGSAPQPRGAATFSSLLPLLLHTRGPHADEARCAIERNALPGGPFWQGELPGFNPGRGGRAGSSSLWRGACSWANMNYCHWSLLRLAGFGTEADLLLDRMTRRLASGPAWEYLDPGFRLPPGACAQTVGRAAGPTSNGGGAGRFAGPGGPGGYPIGGGSVDSRASCGRGRRPGGGGAEPFSWNGLLLAMAEGDVLDLGPNRPQRRSQGLPRTGRKGERRR